MRPRGARAAQASGAIASRRIEALRARRRNRRHRLGTNRAPAARTSARLAYDGGRIFTVNGDGLMGAFDAASGAATSSLQLPGPIPRSRHRRAASGERRAPTASGERRAASGERRARVHRRCGLGWHRVRSRRVDGRRRVDSVGGQRRQQLPAVSSSGVHVSYACGQAYGFSPRSGALLWHRATGCSGGGGTTPVLAGGRLYVRDFSFPAVLDAASGSELGPFLTSGWHPPSTRPTAMS